MKGASGMLACLAIQYHHLFTRMDRLACCRMLPDPSHCPCCMHARTQTPSAPRASPCCASWWAPRATPLSSRVRRTGTAQWMPTQRWVGQIYVRTSFQCMGCCCRMTLSVVAPTSSRVHVGAITVSMIWHLKPPSTPSSMQAKELLASGAPAPQAPAAAAAKGGAPATQPQPQAQAQQKAAAGGVRAPSPVPGRWAGILPSETQKRDMIREDP